MNRENTIGSMDTEEEVGYIFESSIQEVSLSSIRTQDSILNNPMIINTDREEYKEVEFDYRNFDPKETCAHTAPFASLKEAQQDVQASLSANRIRIEIKPIHEVRKELLKLFENFQMWRKQD